LRAKTGQCHGTLGGASISHPAEPINQKDVHCKSNGEDRPFVERIGHPAVVQ
jgi:hypothetical protein